METQQLLINLKSVGSYSVRLNWCYIFTPGLRLQVAHWDAILLFIGHYVIWEMSRAISMRLVSNNKVAEILR